MVLFLPFMDDFYFCCSWVISFLLFMDDFISAVYDFVSAVYG